MINEVINTFHDGLLLGDFCLNKNKIRRQIYLVLSVSYTLTLH